MRTFKVKIPIIYTTGEVQKCLLPGDKIFEIKDNKGAKYGQYIVTSTREVFYLDTRDLLKIEEV